MGYDNLGITENENLWSNITIKRIIEILRKNKDVYVANISRGTNNYGEFLFITIQNDKAHDSAFFYTFGFHELLQKYLTDTAKIGLGNYGIYKTKMKTNVAIRKILSEYRKAKKQSFKYKKLKKEKLNPMNMEMEELEEIGFI